MSELPNQKALRLEGWKCIADYLRRDQATVRRWHKEQGMPVHRESGSAKARVFAFSSELDLWNSGRIISAEPDQISFPPAVKRRFPLAFYILAPIILGLGVFAAYRMILLSAKNVPPPADPSRIFAASTSEGASPRFVELPEEINAVIPLNNGAGFLAFFGGKSYLWKVSISPRTIERIQIGTAFHNAEASPDDRLLYIPTATGIEVYDLDRRQKRTSFDLHRPVYHLVADFPRSELFAATASGGVLKLNLKTGVSQTVTSQTAPYFLSRPAGDSRLFVSYQNGGVNGRDGHDTIEAISLDGAPVATSTSGPPLVGGPIAYSKATGNVWVQMWDACRTPKYDHLGCPAVPTSGFQVFRAADMMHSGVFAPGPGYDRALVFTPNGSLAVIPGAETLVVDAQRRQILERWAQETDYVAYSVNGDRVFLTTGRRVYYFDSIPQLLMSPRASLANQFAFDGTLNDSVEQIAFEPRGEFRYVPGRIGTALRLAPSTTIHVTSSAAWRVGDGTNASLAFWARPTAPTTILARTDDPPWKLRWNANSLYLEVAKGSLQVEMSAGQWGHIVLANDSGKLSLNLNGKFVGEVPQPKTVNAGGYDSYGPIDLDELSVFPKILSPQEIADLIRMPSVLKQPRQ